MPLQVCQTSSSPLLLTSMTAQVNFDAKKVKQARMHARNRQFVLTPKDHRERVIEPLVKQVNKLLLLALALGNSANAAGSSGPAQTDKMVETIRKKFGDFKEHHVKKLRQVGTYYSAVYRVAGKRAEKAANGENPKPRPSVMYRSISKFNPALYNFVREAAATNDALKPAAACATFNKESPLYGHMSPTYAAQFILAYVASNRRFNSENGQYIRPDDLMKKHLGEGIAKVLAGISADKREKEVIKAKKFPGEFTFCKLQELIGFYRLQLPEDSEAARNLTTLRNQQEQWPALLADLETISQIRDQAYKRLHAEQTKPVKAVGPKGPRGPLSEAQKHARRVKREANAAAGVLGYDLNFVEKVPKAASAVPPTSSSNAAAVATA